MKPTPEQLQKFREEQGTRTRLTRDERQRGLTCDKYEITRPSGETFTMYHPK